MYGLQSYSSILCLFIDLFLCGGVFQPEKDRWQCNQRHDKHCESVAETNQISCWTYIHYFFLHYFRASTKHQDCLPTVCGFSATFAAALRQTNYCVWEDNLSVRVCVKCVLCTSLEIQQEPAVTEVEVSVITILLHQFKQLGVQDLTSEEAKRAHQWVWTKVTRVHTHTHTQTHTEMIHHLDQRPHVGKMCVHGSTIREVLTHPLH